MPTSTLTSLDRFWLYVDTSDTDGCHPWTGGHDKDGYPLFKPHSNKSVRAGRWFYALNFGPIPRGLLVCHTCDNPPCLRLEHLFLGTQKDNAQDRNKKGRHSHGESHAHAVLTEELVQTLRARHQAGEALRPLARSLGIARSTAQHVILGDTWYHVI